MSKSTFRVNVVEVHYVRCRYYVDADSAKEAVRLAEAGRHDNDEWLQDYEIIGRIATDRARPVRARGA